MKKLIHLIRKDVNLISKNIGVLKLEKKRLISLKDKRIKNTILCLRKKNYSFFNGYLRIEFYLQQM